MKTILAIAFAMVSFHSFGQSPSTYPATPYTEFYSVDIIDDNIIAIGNCDQVWSSTDGGSTWNYTEIADQYFRGSAALLEGNPNLAIISLVEEVVIYDLATQEIINKSSDGATPVVVAIKVFTRDGDLYATTTRGLFKATLGDYQWQSVFDQPADSDVFEVADIADDFIFIGTRDGKIYSYAMADGATALRSQQEGKIKEITMGTNDIGYIIDVNSTIKKTEDGGATFAESTELRIARNIHAHGSDKVATILGLGLEVSLDGGTTVENYRMSNSRFFGDIDDGFIADDGTIYAYGKGSTIAKSTDDGVTFQFLNPYNRSDFYDLNIYDDGEALACGEHGTVVQSMDNGKSWEPLEMGISEEESINSIDRLSNGNIIVGTSNSIQVIEDGQIIHTEDVAAIDMLITPQETLLSFVNSNGIYQLIRSTDNGMTFTQVLTDLAFTPKVLQANTGTLYLSRQSEGILVSNDDGITWAPISFDIEFQRIYSYNDEVMLGISGRDLYRTTDAGLTWTQIYNAYLINNVIFESPDEFYLTFGQEEATTLMHTADGGETWEQKFYNCALTQAMAINSDSEVIMAQSTGHINVHIEEVTSTEDKSSTLADVYVYPNPVSSNGLLSIDQPWTSLQIIDLQGQAIQSLDHYQNPIRMPELPNGLYILQLNDNGTQQTTKLIVN